MVSSDHKPVCAIFDTKVRKLDRSILQTKSYEIVRQLDIFENLAMPVLEISNNQCYFGEVVPKMAVTRTLEFKNSGNVIARFQLVSKNDQKDLLKPWFKVHPQQSAIFPGFVD